MKKEERIRRYGKEAYKKMQQQIQEWNEQHQEEKRNSNQEWVRTHQEEKRNSDREYGRAHQEEAKERNQLWGFNNPEKTKARQHEGNRKGGKYYEQQHKHQMNGIPHEKALVRGKHKRIWTPYKRIIAPESQIHHQWLPNTSKYRGIALVEKEQHIHGFVDVIQILEGEITLLTEEEVRNEGVIK